MHVEIKISPFFAAPTIREMAEHIETLIEAGPPARAASTIVRVAWENEGRQLPSRRNDCGSCSEQSPELPFFHSSFRCD